MSLDQWVLPLIAFLPLVVAVLVIVMPDEPSQKMVALVGSFIPLGLVVWLLANYDYSVKGAGVDKDGLQFSMSKSWIPLINARFHIGIEGLGLPMLALSCLIIPLCIIYSWNHFPEPHNPKAFLALMLVLETGMSGTFISQDLILFFVFFELVLLPMYFMIGVWGGPNRQYASLKFFLYTMFGSAFMLLGFLAMYFKATGANGTHTFQIAELAINASKMINPSTQKLIFAGLFLGFAIKVPMFPFHTWLPDAHTEAPTQGSVILAAVLLKLGTYGFIKIALPILPEGAKFWSPIIGGLASIGIIYGALGCLAQTDFKRLIAFSSVAHMGYVMLGISTLTTTGINAAVFGMVAHGFITGMLFFCAGSIKERFHTLEIKRLGGLLKQMPKLGWVLGFASMASLGLPGLAGFWGEFPAILSAYQPHASLSESLFRFFMVVAAVGTVFAAGYLLWLYQRTAFGEPKAEWEGHEFHDVVAEEWAAWIPMLVAILVLGLFPYLLFRMTDVPVHALVDHLDAVLLKGK
jgi:NADH-quinone oxidoreductase subunit M